MSIIFLNNCRKNIACVDVDGKKKLFVYLMVVLIFVTSTMYLEETS